MPAPESALVVLVPEAEALVKPFRDLHDPSAAVGVPAHVTLIYPFKPPHEITEPIIDGLRQCFADFPAFTVSFEILRRFPGVLYLAPEPVEPLQKLTRVIWKQHPETPPYGGRHLEIVPHLTLAQIADGPRLDQIAGEFTQAAHERLPIRLKVSNVALLENLTGRWRTRLTLPLGT